MVSSLDAVGQPLASTALRTAASSRGGVTISQLSRCRVHRRLRLGGHEHQVVLAELASWAW